MHDVPELKELHSPFWSMPSSCRKAAWDGWGMGAILTYFWEAEGTTVICFSAAGGSRWIAGP